MSAKPGHLTTHSNQGGGDNLDPAEDRHGWFSPREGQPGSKRACGVEDIVMSFEECVWVAHTFLVSWRKPGMLEVAGFQGSQPSLTFPQELMISEPHL
jgi:hypothetical protein